MTVNADIPDAVGESRHLPECEYGKLQQWNDGSASINTQCTCAALRACEQRVKRVERPLWHLKGATWGREQGWNEALDEAQQAIRNREDGEYFPWVQVEIALAAINSLRGEA